MKTYTRQLAAKEKDDRADPQTRAAAMALSPAFTRHFDPRDPFWLKFIKVTRWKKDEKVRSALQDEEERDRRLRWPRVDSV